MSALQQQLMLMLSSIDGAEEVFTLESIMKFISRAQVHILSLVGETWPE